MCFYISVFICVYFCIDKALQVTRGRHIIEYLQHVMIRTTPVNVINHIFSGVGSKVSPLTNNCGVDKSNNSHLVPLPVLILLVHSVCVSCFHYFTYHA